MNRSGILLDSGPTVAPLCGDDNEHDRVEQLSAECLPPFRCCEAVIAEACFLMRKVHAAGPGEVIALRRKGVHEISMSLEDHWTSPEALLRMYSDRHLSLADACLIRCAKIHEEARTLTLDSDLGFHRWGRNRRFQLL